MTVTLSGTSGSNEVGILHYHIILQITGGFRREKQHERKALRMEGAGNKV